MSQTRIDINNSAKPHDNGYGSHFLAQHIHHFNASASRLKRSARDRRSPYDSFERKSSRHSGGYYSDYRNRSDGYHREHSRSPMFKHDCGWNGIRMDAIDDRSKISVHSSNTPTVSGFYCCITCGKQYSKKQYAIDHRLTIHLKSKMNYSCKLCGQWFSWRASVLKHVKKYHQSVHNTSHMIDLLYNLD